MNLNLDIRFYNTVSPNMLYNQYLTWIEVLSVVFLIVSFNYTNIINNKWSKHVNTISLLKGKPDFWLKDRCWSVRRILVSLMMMWWLKSWSAASLQWWTCRDLPSLIQWGWTVGWSYNRTHSCSVPSASSDIFPAR